MAATYIAADLLDLVDVPAWAVEYHRDADAPMRLRTWQAFPSAQAAHDRADDLVAQGFRTALVMPGESLARKFFRA